MARNTTQRIEEPAHEAPQETGFAAKEEARRGTGPSAHIRVGNVHASVFTNEGTNGLYESVKFQKSYKKDGESQRQFTDSFSAGDLLELAKAADKAHDKIMEIQQQRYQGQAR